MEASFSGKPVNPESLLRHWRSDMMSDLHLYHRNICPARSLCRHWTREEGKLLPVSPYGAVVDLVSGMQAAQPEHFKYFLALQGVSDMDIADHGVTGPEGRVIRLERRPDRSFVAFHG